jgi:hypothetical protein
MNFYIFDYFLYSIIETVVTLYSTSLLILLMVIVYFNKFVDKKSPEEYQVINKDILND